MQYKQILDGLIEKDIFGAVIAGDNSEYYISDFLADVLEKLSDACIIYNINTPPVWVRLFGCDLSDDPELKQTAAALAYMQAELNRLEHSGAGAVNV